MSASQAERRGFDSHRPLHFFIRPRERGSAACRVPFSLPLHGPQGIDRRPTKSECEDQGRETDCNCAFEMHHCTAGFGHVCEIDSTLSGAGLEKGCREIPGRGADRSACVRQSDASQASVCKEAKLCLHGAARCQGGRDGGSGGPGMDDCRQQQVSSGSRKMPGSVPRFGMDPRPGVLSRTGFEDPVKIRPDGVSAGGNCPVDTGRCPSYTPAVEKRGLSGLCAARGMRRIRTGEQENGQDRAGRV